MWFYGRGRPVTAGSAARVAGGEQAGQLRDCLGGRLDVARTFSGFLCRDLAISISREAPCSPRWVREEWRYSCRSQPVPGPVRQYVRVPERESQRRPAIGRVGRPRQGPGSCRQRAGEPDGARPVARATFPGAIRRADGQHGDQGEPREQENRGHARRADPTRTRRSWLSTARGRGDRGGTRGVLAAAAVEALIANRKPDRLGRAVRHASRLWASQDGSAQVGGSA